MCLSHKSWFSIFQGGHEKLQIFHSWNPFVSSAQWKGAWVVKDSYCLFSKNQSISKQWISETVEGSDVRQDNFFSVFFNVRKKFNTSAHFDTGTETIEKSEGREFLPLIFQSNILGEVVTTHSFSWLFLYRQHPSPSFCVTWRVNSLALVAAKNLKALALRRETGGEKEFQETKSRPRLIYYVSPIFLPSFRVGRFHLFLISRVWS